jgi:predicted outer membrane protein
LRQQSAPAGRNRFTGTGLLTVALAATLVALLYPVWSYAERPAATAANTGTVSAQSARNASGAKDGRSTPQAGAPQPVSTKYGPLTALDRTFLDAVRTAALWELPAGRQAEKKGTTAAVRTAGQHVVAGHTFLARRVADVDSRLGITPPAATTAQQKKSLSALGRATGKDYDRTFANTLRLADGKFLPVVAEVRAGTRNSLVRDLADDAEVTVLDHIRVLEATGDVDFAALSRALGVDTTPTPSPSGSPLSSGTSPATPAPAPSATYSLPPAASSPPPTGSGETGSHDTPQRQADDRTTAPRAGTAQDVRDVGAQGPGPQDAETAR